MKINRFKTILRIFDEVERYELTLNTLPLAIYEELNKQNQNYPLKEIKDVIAFLHHLKLISETNYSVDLHPAITIYAKSSTKSKLEAISLVESMLDNSDVKRWIKHDFSPKYYELIPTDIAYLLNATSLFNKNSLNKTFIKPLKQIYEEVVIEKELLSTYTTALYTSNIVEHNNTYIEYKNENYQIIDYKHLNTILNIIPRLGIPHDRDQSKSLQAFYKDTLFNEFDHACPICHAHISHMLIASHIKPFRDCAHIYEAIDHNNGMLLCRNHDFLFDQGYITFLDNGEMLISSRINPNDYPFYGLNPKYNLPKPLLTKYRLKFLKYHRNHIFIP